MSLISGENHETAPDTFRISQSIDIIGNFDNGTDLLDLTGGLTLGQLIITDNDSKAKILVTITNDIIKILKSVDLISP